MVSLRRPCMLLLGAALTLVLLMAALLPSATPAAADTFAVTDLTDAALASPSGTSCVSTTAQGTCTLRAATQAAKNLGGAQFIALAVPGTYTLTLGELTIDSSTLTLANTSAGAVAIDGNSSSRVLNIGPSAAATASLVGVTVQHGNSGAAIAGGVLVGSGSSLTLVDSAVANNASQNSGGGLYVTNAGTAHLTSSALTGNHAPSGAGLVVASGGTADLLNVTVANNVATSFGGAAAVGGQLSLTHVTVTGNSSPTAGQLHVGAGSITLQRSIVAANANGNCSSGGGSLTSQGDNIDDDGTCNLGANDHPSTPALLGALGSYGGMTQTVPLLAGSPAIDGVTHNTCAPPSTDQRGVARPQGPRCDIGAYERDGDLPPTIGAIANQTTAEDTPTGAIAFTVDDGDTAATSLTLSADSSNPTLVPNANVVFGGSGNNRTVTLAPSGDQTGTADITVTVSDGSLTAGTTFRLTVTAVNDAPVNHVTAAQTVNENVPLVFTAGNGNLISVSDVDAGNSPVQVALTATDGTVSLNGVSGLTVVGGANGTASITVVGSLANLNNALNGLRFTPTAGFSGAASLQIATDDQGNTGSGGPKSDIDSIAITVVAVNEPPTAADDSYSVGATQALTVPAATGVLANDTDPEGSPLTAVLVTNPAHGTLALSPNGSFTYRATATFAGSDSFSYRASDGVAVSSPATVTITVTPSRCAPRPSVRVSTTIVGGKLQATVEALPLDDQTNNRLHELRFGAFQNGRVTVNGQTIASGASYTVPNDTTRTVFLVERVTPGQATTIPLTAVDECGAWPSFVGGGAAAGF